MQMSKIVKIKKKKTVQGERSNARLITCRGLAINGKVFAFNDWALYIGEKVDVINLITGHTAVFKDDKYLGELILQG